MDEPSSSDLRPTTAASESQPGAGYAPGGSLAREMAKEKELPPRQEAHSKPE